MKYLCNGKLTLMKRIFTLKSIVTLNYKSQAVDFEITAIIATDCKLIIFLMNRNRSPVIQVNEI